MFNSDQVYLSIARIPIMLSISALDEAARSRLLEHYAQFLVPAQPVALSVELRQEAGPEFIPFGRGTWQVHTMQHGPRVSFDSHLERGWLDLDAKAGSLTLRPKGEPENFLRVIYAYLGLARGGLVVHAAGVVRKGQGYVFFGPSGSGKTTISSLSLDHQVLSDDLVMLRVDGEGVRLFGAPFRGDIPEAPRSNGEAGLRGLYMLVKDSMHQVRDLPEGEAIARLSACIPFVMHQPEQAARVLALCAEIERRVHIRALHFRRDSGFWEVVDRD